MECGARGANAPDPQHLPRRERARGALPRYTASGASHRQSSVSPRARTGPSAAHPQVRRRASHAGLRRPARAVCPRQREGHTGLRIAAPICRQK